jgi:hypothetical protein
MLPKSSLSSAASATHQTHQMPVPEPSSPVQQHGQEVDSKLPQIQSRQQPESYPARVFEEPQYDNIPLILNKAKKSRFLPFFNESQNNEGEQEIWQQKGGNGEPSNVVRIVPNLRQNAPHQPKQPEELQPQGKLVTVGEGKDKEATDFGPIAKEKEKSENAKDKTTEHAVMGSSLSEDTDHDILNIGDRKELNKKPERESSAVKSHPISVGINMQYEPTEPQTTEPLENSPKSPKKEFEKMGDQTEEITAQVPSHEDAGMGKKKANLSEKEVQKRKKGKWLRKKKPKFVAKQKVESGKLKYGRLL